MSDIKVLDKDQLAQLWTKMNNTFMQSGGVPSSWLASEYDKRNLINSSNIIAGRRVESATGEISSEDEIDGTDYIEIEPSTRYINNCNPLWSSTYGVAFFTSNKTFIGGYNASSSSYRDFTTPSNAKYLIICWYNTGVWKTSNPSLSRYGGGEIIRANDVEPVLLWENGSPSNSTFTNQSITLNESVYNFKYTIFAIKQEGTNSEEGLMYYKIQPPKIVNRTFFRVSYMWANGTKGSVRYFDLIDATIVNVSKGYAYGVEDNTQCIPIAIYGSNL